MDFKERGEMGEERDTGRSLEVEVGSGRLLLSQEKDTERGGKGGWS